MLHELGYLETLLRGNETSRALHTLKRILTVLKVMVAQIDVLETMTPLEFLSFRDRLESGSGFQSFQFRELEFLLGTKSPTAIARYPEGSEPRRRLEARYRQPRSEERRVGKEWGARGAPELREEREVLLAQW